MYLAHENAQTQLKIFMDNIAPKPQSWRIISIEFQDCETLHSPLFQNICLKNLQHCFDQTECRIYWVKPSFILVFFQGRALPIEKCVEEFLKETEFKGFGRFFDILDLSIHWNSLLELVARIAKIKDDAAQTQMRVAETANQPAKINSVYSQQTSSSNEEALFQMYLIPEKIKQMVPVRSGRIKPLLLLVEDDPFTLQLVKLALKDVFEIISAETARQAISFYQRHLPDMVFQDIQLPDGNGIQLLKQMMSADRDAHVVMLSSHTQKEKILECLELGAKGFIGKPFTRQRLLDAAQKFKDTRKSLVAGGAA